MAPLRCVYCDLDGTLLGRRASFLHDADGSFSLLGARALEACARADVEFVIYSGRQRATLLARRPDARRAQLRRSRRARASCSTARCTGSPAPTSRTASATCASRSRPPARPRCCSRRYPGRLEHFDPFLRDREVSYLLRGEVDAAEADALLAEHGFVDLRLLDNGAIAKRSPALPGIERPRAYHLLPRDASKARGVEFHMRARGYAPEDCIAIGDSREDLGASRGRGRRSGSWPTAWPATRRCATRCGGNVRVCEGRNGEGVYEAVITELAERTVTPANVNCAG